MSDMQATSKQPQALSQSTQAGLLDQIVTQGRFGTDEDSRARARDVVSRFVDEVVQGHMAPSRTTLAMINARIRQIDEALSLQLNEILHAPEFQKLEATWRGLKYLVSETETGPMLKIKIFNASKAALLDDFEENGFDQSALWTRVYEHEYGMYGGVPFSALVGDFAFGPGSQDVKLLQHMSTVAAGAHAPFLTGTAPEMLGVSDLTKLNDPVSLAEVFEGSKYAAWNAFRQTEDSRYVALTLPRMLLREPYGKDTIPIKAFNFEEGIDGKTHGDYLWGNAAWALASKVTQSFAKYQWCATIRGVESGGRVERLPVHNYTTESGNLVMKCPTEVQIPERRDRELSELGFAALVHEKGTPNATFFAVQSAQKPKTYSSPAATANAALSARIPYIFAASRFAHYLKVIMRDKIGGFMSRSEAQTYLRNWIANYRLDMDEAPFEAKAKRPLREAQIDVEEIPGKPGAYRAKMSLRPHFQLEELQVSMSLVAQLPESAK
jgi:type VI secretion system protein ImpC